MPSPDKPVGIWHHDVNDFLAAGDRELNVINLPGVDFLSPDAAGAIRASLAPLMSSSRLDGVSRSAQWHNDSPLLVLSTHFRYKPRSVAERTMFPGAGKNRSFGSYQDRSPMGRPRAQQNRQADSLSRLEGRCPDLRIPRGDLMVRGRPANLASGDCPATNGSDYCKVMRQPSEPSRTSRGAGRINCGFE